MPAMHKFNKVLTLTYEDAFKWKLGYYIEMMLQLAEYIGREKLIELIKRAVDNCSKGCEKDDPGHTIPRFNESGRNAFKNMMIWEIIEESDTLYEIKTTECLWEKTFRERGASDMGYAMVCHASAHNRFCLTVFPYAPLRGTTRSAWAGDIFSEDFSLRRNSRFSRTGFM